MKKIVIRLGLLLSLVSASVMAENGNHAFTEQAIQKELGQYTVYQVKINNEQSLAFVVNDKDNKATARLLTSNGKSYRVLSAYYCVSETDHCWTNVLYNESLANFAYQLGQYRKEYELSWSIDYIDGNNLERTDWSDMPQLGALSKFEEADEMDDNIPYLDWDTEPRNYQ